MIRAARGGPDDPFQLFDQLASLVALKLGEGGGLGRRRPLNQAD